MLNLIFFVAFALTSSTYYNTTDKYIATAYCLQGITASGTRVRSGIIAADPRLHKLGSKVKVNGTVYIVTDTGGKIKGKRIDIWMKSCSSARKFGRRVVQLDKM